MTKPRKSLISVADTPYYHVINRCVRRAFLCGIDRYSGIDYSHRRQWMINRIQQTEKAFCIDVCAYAIMSNHYHLVLHIDSHKELTNKEIAIRWGMLYILPEIVTDWLNNKQQSKSAHEQIQKKIKLWRKRLYSISWFMRSINEAIAREANKEDKVTGRFWQGRFYSQALLDERALLQCMMYVELNPIRAGIAKELQGSDYTSIQQRIRELTGKSTSKEKISLMSFSKSKGQGNNDSTMPYNLKDYLELVDWTGRALLAHKRGYVPASVPRLINQLSIDKTKWIKSCAKQSVFYRVLGKAAKIIALAKTLNQGTFHGIKQNKDLFG